MKNWRIFLSGLVLFFSPMLLAKKEHAVLANGLSWIVGNYEASYEKRLDKHFSLSSSVIYYEGRKVLYRIYSYGYFVGIGAIPKWHIYGHAHDHSFYLAPSMRFGYVFHPAQRLDQKDDFGLLSRLGANFGFQHIFDSGLIIDLTAGVEHNYSFSLSKKPTRYQSSSEGKLRFDLRPYIGTMIGFAF